MDPQQIKKKVKLYVHVFPSTEFDWDHIQIDKDKKTVYIQRLTDPSSNLPGKKPVIKYWSFKTDEIFYNNCPHDVYNSVRDSIFNKAYYGVNSVVMSYGQNYAGKTFITSGLYNSYELRGLIPRFATDLFTENERKRKIYSVKLWLSVVDIYKNSLFDLLSNNRKCYDDKKCIKSVFLKSYEQCLELLFKAETYRLVTNCKSYKAHLASNVVTFTIRTTSEDSQDTYDKICKIHFVDLAGVETVHRNETTSYKDGYSQGDANVTKTLLELFALKIQTLNKSHLPVDQKEYLLKNKMHILTDYLGKAFSPWSNITLICHIRPSQEDLKITLSLLKFGTIFKNVPIFTHEPQLEINSENTIKQLREQVRLLQDELLIRSLQEESCPIQISQERIDFVKRSVQSYLNGHLAEDELISVVNDCSLILKILREITFDSKLDNATQTDDKTETNIMEYPELPQRFSNENQKVPNILVALPSNMVEKSSITSTKHVSFVKSKKQSKTGKTGKKEKDKNKKLKEAKPEFVSKEVQINLIEPDAKMPEIDTRQSHWARFLICRQDIQLRLDKFFIPLRNKEKLLNSEKLICKEIHHIITDIQERLHTTESINYFDDKDVGDSERKSDEKLELLQRLKKSQIDLETSKQKVVQLQIEWLNALEMLNNEKQIVETEFQQFCQENNLLPLEVDIYSNKRNSNESEKQLSDTVVFESTSVEFQELYNRLQEKCLTTVYIK